MKELKKQNYRISLKRVKNVLIEKCFEVSLELIL
jgi:hypothetical protein